VSVAANQPIKLFFRDNRHTQCFGFFNFSDLIFRLTERDLRLFFLSENIRIIFRNAPRLKIAQKFSTFLDGRE
jgi:hypothetical protein